MRRAQDRARSATIESRALGALKLASQARNENVPAKRADFFYSFKVRKRLMAFTQKRDSTFKLSALHHSYLTIILFMVLENRLFVVLRFDEV